MKLVASVAVLLTATLFASPASAVLVFDNQFNTTWDLDNDNNGVFESTNIATVTPTLVNAKFRQNSGSSQVWNVSVLTPQPWNLGGVIFAGGGNTSGAISTEFNAVAGAVYTIDWDADLIGANTTPRHVLTLEAFDGSGFGGTLLGSQVLDTDPAGLNGQIVYVAPTTGIETIRVRLSTLGNNSSTDIQLDFVTVNAVLPIPEPATAALALLGLPALLRRRQRLA